MIKKQTTIVTRKKVWLHFAAIMVVALFAVSVIAPKYPTWAPLKSFFDKFNPRMGLDIQGGAHFVYQADVSSIALADRDSAMAGVRDVIERRVNAFGVSEPIVQTASNNRLIVELAGITDVNDAIKKIGETPLLEFKEQGTPTPVVLTDADKKEIKKYNDAQLAKAKSLIVRLQKGEDFATLAKEFSEDPGSKDNGGDLGFAKTGSFVPEFETAAFSLKDGAITLTPVKSDFGYHIIKKIAEKGTGDAREVQTSHILLATKSETPASSTEPQWQNTKLSGRNLKKSAVEFDPNTGKPLISIEFDSEGQTLFAEITKRNVGKPVAIYLDNSPISIPTVNEEITQGRAVITGSFTLPEAKLLAQRLNAGALPVPIELISQQTVGPTLGKISLQKSLMAGIIGLALVALFMIFYYRLMGLFAVIALMIYAAVSFAIFEMWPVTLTLSGIAGFILSVGMAVDANVLIFERTKEELRNGKPLGTSIEEGFARAWTSIRDSNVSSLITCAILAWFGSSLIKGFAITLGIGILVSMFTAITVTRNFLRILNIKSLGRHLWLFCVAHKEEKK
jgi:preprotein translocase subunit SecD